MTEELVIRRSYRLKNKPSPKYDYQNYLKLAICTASTPAPMSKRPKSKNDDSLDVDTRPISSTRVLKKREMTAAKKKKYDDIFTSVVANAFMMDVKKTPAEYFAAKKRKQIRKYSEVDVESSETDSEKDDDILVLEEKVVKLDKPMKDESDGCEVLEVEVVKVSPFACACGRRFEQHMDCHKHIFDEHGDDELYAECVQCRHRLDDIRTNNVCIVCGQFAVKLEDHLASHYRNCTAKTAVMECRFCTKQFLTVKEVVEHEKQKHLLKTVKKPKQYYKCNECSMEFLNTEALGVHYYRHLDIPLLCDRLAELQYKVQAAKEECPFCRTHVSSRKTFRAHVLKKHYAACKSIVSMSEAQLHEQPSDFELKQEINDLIKSVSTQNAPVKREVKEEVHDDDEYLGC